MSSQGSINYSIKEIVELINQRSLNSEYRKYEEKFKRRLQSICNDENGENRFGYNLNFLDFKEDEDNSDSNFYLPPEIAIPLIILIKNIDYHPYCRKKKANNIEVAASQIAEYSKRILDDIDNTDYSIFKDMIYSYNAHVTTLELSYWVEPFIRSLTHFVINSLQQNENIGQALRFYTKKLDSFNYNLHRGMMLNKAFNIEQENLSIDHLLVKCIKEGLDIAKNSKKTGILNFDELLRLEKPDLPAYNTSYIDEDSTKKTIETITNLPIKEQRKIYLEIVLRKRINIYKLKNNSVAVEKKKEAQKWQPLDKRIENGDKGVYNEQMKNKLIEKISYCNKMIESWQRSKEYHQQKLEELNKTGHCSVNFNVDNIFMPTEIRHADYVSHCQTLDNDPTYLPLKNVLDNMVGQALRYFIENRED